MFFSSCFSQYFGGSCIGTPDGCEECLGICKEKEPGEYILPASDSIAKRGGASSDFIGATFDEDQCKYTCKTGGCSVRILPKSGFVSGKTMG